MKAVIYGAYGGPEVLEVADIAEPKMGQNGVLVRIVSAGLNPADYVLQSGAGDSSIGAFFPVIPGRDFAGIVETAGPGVSEFLPGHEVIGHGREAVLRHGTYAALFAAEAEMLARKPKQSTWEQAAGLPLAGLAAYQAVTRDLRVQDGETLLVHGAAGGVGSLSAQIGIAAGARVIGTASPRNHPYLRSIGVEPVIIRRSWVRAPAAPPAIDPSCPRRGATGRWRTLGAVYG
jgi:NADPH:quinone reductase-like Zn-dependent oxidoreductase